MSTSHSNFQTITFQQPLDLLSSQTTKKQFNIPMQILIQTKIKLPPPDNFEKIRAKTHNNKYHSKQSYQFINKQIHTDNITTHQLKIKKHSNSQTILKSHSHTTTINTVKNKHKAKSKKTLSLYQNNTNSFNNNYLGHLKNKVLSVYTLKTTTQILKTKNNFYDHFIKQLNIKLPTPKQKFLQFMHIQPFNRLPNHIQFITHMLKSSLNFFKMHPQQIIQGISKKIIILSQNQLPSNYIIILNQGLAYYSAKLIQKGSLICRNHFNPNLFSYDGDISLVGLPFHQYFALVTQYLNANLHKFRKYIEQIQIFQIFTPLTMQKIFTSLTLNYLSKGEYLSQSGDPSTSLYLIYSGLANRKIIVQIDKTNRIPLQRCNKLIKILSCTYQHYIKFQSSDLIICGDMIGNDTYSTSSIVIEENTIILTIDRNALQDNLDEFVLDRLKKYYAKKYPKNYEQLSQNYIKQKLQFKLAQQRKISALKDEINKNIHNIRKKQKISNIIQIYQHRKKIFQNQHLVHKKKIQKVIYQ